jgi:hypothetical protein
MVLSDYRSSADLVLTGTGIPRKPETHDSNKEMMATISWNPLEFHFVESPERAEFLMPNTIGTVFVEH